MRIKDEIKLDFKDVLIRPKCTTFIRVNRQINDVFLR